IALGRYRLVTVELNVLGHKSRFGELLGVEVVLALNVFVEQRKASADRTGVDFHVDAAGLGFLVQGNGALCLVKALALRAQAQVFVAEVHEGVAGFNLIGHRRCLSGKSKQKTGGQGNHWLDHEGVILVMQGEGGGADASAYLASILKLTVISLATMS